MHMKPWFLVSGTHMCGISYEDSKILSSTLKDSQWTITSVQLSFKERVPTLTLNPNTFNRWKLSKPCTHPQNLLFLGFWYSPVQNFLSKPKILSRDSQAELWFKETVPTLTLITTHSKARIGCELQYVQSITRLFLSFSGTHRCRILLRKLRGT